MKHTIARILVSGIAAGTVLFSGIAAAIDWNVTGFVRQEIAYSISGDVNRNNLMESQWNDVIVPHLTHINYGTGANFATPTTTWNNATTGAQGFFVAGLPLNTLPAGANTSSSAGCRFGRERAIAAGATGFFGTGTFLGSLCGSGAGTNNTGFGDSNVIPGASQATPGGATAIDARGAMLNDDINFNQFNTRAEVDVQARFNREFAAYMKVRAYFDGTRAFTDGEMGDVFGTPFLSNRRGTYTEWNSPDTMIDIPALYLDWNRGPLWIRLGNQTIAWGEAYFFRVMDVANGLDLRRHLALGPGAEEYQDQRVASPGIRVSYTFKNGWELDAFAQMFSPSVLPGQNTPYNVVGFSVYLDEEEAMDDAENAINFGARLTMPLTDQFTAMIAYVNRRNPDGVATGADAPTFWRGTANPFCLGPHNDTNNLLGALGLQGLLNPDPNLSAVGLPSMPDIANYRGSRLGNRGCGTSFAPDPFAANSHEVIDNVATARIDAAHYFTTQINEFPGSQWATREIFGFGNELSFADVMRTSEGFRSSFGGITQWVTRQFKRENVLIVGGNYIINTEDPASFWDQMIIRGEVSITPDKKFTNDLSFELTETTDIVSALIFEKYHRFTDAFPSTYMVMQWMHRTDSDLFNRDLDKNHTLPVSAFLNPDGSFNALGLTPGGMTPEGDDNANYVVFAFQQPFPNLVWRFDFAVLVDVAGGYLLQPGVRYRPAANWQWDLYANLIESPGGDNDTITETLDWADEIFVRLTYFF